MASVARPRTQPQKAVRGHVNGVRMFGHAPATPTAPAAPTTPAASPAPKAAAKFAKPIVGGRALNMQRRKKAKGQRAAEELVQKKAAQYARTKAINEAYTVKQGMPITRTKLRSSTRCPPETPMTWPPELRNMLVISIRDTRWKDFRQRMGTWAEHATLLPGTVGSNIKLDAWAHKLAMDTQYREGGKLGYMRRGQIGCYDSHVRAWRQVVERDLPYALVMEDDAAVVHSPATVAKLETGFREIEEYGLEYDVLHLGHSFGRVRARLSPHIYEADLCQGAFMYLVTNAGARKLLAQCEPYRYPVDCYMYRVPDIRILALHPRLCYVVPVVSDTEHIH